MIYILGPPSLVASAAELVVASVTGLGGSLKNAMHVLGRVADKTDYQRVDMMSKTLSFWQQTVNIFFLSALRNASSFPPNNLKLTVLFKAGIICLDKEGLFYV